MEDGKQLSNGTAADQVLQTLENSANFASILLLIVINIKI